MFGPVWPIQQWAVLGAVIGAVFQLVQAMNLGEFARGYAFVSGRVLGGLLLGAFVGALVALIRNQMAGRR